MNSRPPTTCSVGPCPCRGRMLLFELPPNHNRPSGALTRSSSETEELAAVVGRHPQVQRLLCGHLHHPVHEHWGGTLATTMPSIALDVRKGVDVGPVKDATMYQVHVMSGQAGLISHTRIVTA